jgi:hypothetical protein
VDGIGVGLCSVTVFGISTVEPLGSVFSELISEKDLTEVGCRDRM